MKNILFTLTTFFLFTFSSTLWAQTQAEMNQTTINEFKKADNDLNQVYKKLLNKIDAKEKKLLITAQKNWIKFRDSKCDFEKEQFNGGSIQPAIYYTCLTAATTKRTQELKDNLEDREKR